MGAMQHLVFLIFSLIAFSHTADSRSITELLDKGGLTTFSQLVNKTGAIEAYNSALDKKGLTIFAPSNSAFASPVIKEALKMLKPDEVVALLKYHAVGDYISTVRQGQPIPTLATGDSGNYILKATNDGSTTTVIAEENSAQIVETIYNFNQLLIVKVNGVFEPSALFGLPCGQGGCDGK